MPNFSGKNNPMYGISLSKELSPNWLGGKSFEPYGIEFDKKFKQFIKNRDLNMCQTPGCMEIEDLCVHHIDYNKQNNILENAITLCRSCHSKTNGKKKRQYFIEFYQNIMMGKLKECLL